MISEDIINEALAATLNKVGNKFPAFTPITTHLNKASLIKEQEALKEKLDELIHNNKLIKNRNLDNIDDWATPDYFYNPLNKEFDFNFDPCPLQHDITKWDGLIIDWKERNFIRK